VLGRAGEGTVVDALGVVLSLGAGLAYAILTVASRRLLDAGLPPTTAMARVFVVGAVPSIVVLAAGDGASLLTGRGLALVGWLAIVTVGVGYALYAAGLRVLRPATVGTLTLTEPLVAAMLGVAVLGERPGGLAVLGAVLLALGLVLVAREPVVETPQVSAG
jgi:DME family drug/metabolite transporter